MAVLTGLLFLGLIVLLKRRERVARILRDSAPILLFFSYCLISLIWSDYPAVAFKRWNKAIGDWVMILIIWTDPQPITALMRLLARTTYTLIPLSIVLIKYYPGLGRSYSRWTGQVAYYGVCTDKNTLGAICLLFGLASVWRVLNLFGDERKNMQRRRHLIAQVVILAMIWWLFSIIDSMTSLSCLLVGTCVLFAIRFRIMSRSRFLVHCFLVIMVVIPVSVALLGVSPDTLQAMGRNSTLTERTDIWAMVITLVPNRWVGAGYESFWLGPRLDAMISNVTRWWVPNQSHNGYLEIFANLGWLGIGLLTVVIVWGYQRVIRAWRWHVPVGDLMIAYFLTGVISNISEAAFFRMMTPIWMFFLLAITVPQATRQPSSRESISSNVPICEPTGVLAPSEEYV
jgi:O-antigen ligase